MANVDLRTPWIDWTKLIIDPTDEKELRNRYEVAQALCPRKSRGASPFNSSAHLYMTKSLAPATAVTPPPLQGVQPLEEGCGDTC
jgi:hypothetical protein